MPGERRNSRPSKDTSSSTNGEKARSNSQSSSSKDKPVPTRAPSKGKAQPAKKSTKDPTGDNHQANGEPIENGINGSEDVEMQDEIAEKNKTGSIKEGEEEMTVVVPPPNSSKLAGDSQDPPSEDAMEGVEKVDSEGAEGEQIDPKAKAVSGSSYVSATRKFSLTNSLEIQISKQTSASLIVQSPNLMLGSRYVY